MNKLDYIGSMALELAVMARELNQPRLSMLLITAAMFTEMRTEDAGPRQIAPAPSPQD